MEARDGSWRISLRMRRPDPRALVADWSAPFLLALLTVLGALQLLDALDVVYYPMIHGATSTMRFDLGLSLVPLLLFLLFIWISWVIWKKRFRALPFPILAMGLYPFTSLEVVVSIGSLLAVAGGIWANREIVRYLSGVLALLSSIEALSLLHWVVFLPIGLSSSFRWYANLEMGLFYLAAHLAPFLVIPLMYLWVFKLLIYWRGRNKIEYESFEHNNREGISRSVIFILLLSMSLGVVAALYPYLPSVNSRNRSAGADFLDYVVATEIIKSDVFQVFNISGGSRPLIYMVIYGFQYIFGLDVTNAIRYIPVFLNPLLVITIFVLALEMYNDSWIASWASFFTVCGIQISVGMFSYFLTNVLALSIIFLSLGLLFRALRKICYFSLFYSSLIGFLLVFTHPWTFNHYYIAIVFMAFFIWYIESKSNKGHNKVKIVFLYLIFLGISEIVKSELFHGYGGMSASSLAIGNIDNLSRFWYNTVFFFRRIYCGLEANIILLGLTVTTLLFTKMKQLSEVFLIGFLAVTSLPFLFCDAMIKSRLLYNIPIGLYTAYSFTLLNKQIKIKKFYLFIKIFILVSMMVYLFRSIANII
ncbi:MAG: hypothetical protein ACFFDN_02985 [Candidatus Hodarchaeota archaeon]